MSARDHDLHQLERPVNAAALGQILRFSSISTLADSIDNRKAARARLDER